MSIVDKIIAALLRDQAGWIEAGMSQQADVVAQCIDKVRAIQAKESANTSTQAKGIDEWLTNRGREMATFGAGDHGSQ